MKPPSFLTNLLLIPVLALLPCVSAVSRACRIGNKFYRNGESEIELRDNQLFRCVCSISSESIKRICKSANEEALMYVADGTTIRKFLLIDGVGFERGFIIGLQGTPVSVGVDSNRDYVFWSDVSNKGRGIYRARASDGKRITNIVSKDIFEPNGLAVDWLAQNIYWTDAQLGSVSVADYNGKNIVRLIGGLSEPRGIVVVPREGLMFWGDQTEGTIERAALDGSDHRVIVFALVWPNEMVVDEAERRIYWIDGHNNKIERCDFEGNNHETIYHVLSDSPAFGLALFGNRFYFGVWNDRSVYSITKIGRLLKKAAPGVGSKTMGIAITNEELQNRTRISNPCWAEQRQCSHICLPITASEYRCACPSNTGLVLADDGQNCVVPENFLLYTSLDDGTVMMLSTGQRSSRIPTTFAQSHQPSAIDFDPIDQVAYWSDVAMNVIYRKPLSDAPPEVFLQDGVGTVDGLCVDWVNRHLYFTNIGTAPGGVTYHRVELVDLRDVSKRRILTSSGFSRPRAIVLDYANGIPSHLYVSDWGDDAKITRLDLDGRNPRVVPMPVENPNGLALRDRYLYVTDSHRNSALLQSNGTIIYLESPTLMRFDTVLETYSEIEIAAVEMQLPFGLAVHGNNLYFTDWDLGGLYETSTSGLRASALVVGIKKPTGVVYGSTTASKNVSTACTRENLCSEICIAESEEYICLCPDQSGKVQSSSNNWNCVPPDSFVMVADVDRIMMTSLSPPDRAETYAVVRTFDQLSDIVAVTFDPLDRYIYWADNGRAYVGRRAMDAGGPENIEKIYTNIFQVDSMALDKDNRLLYWTDVVKGTIEVMDLRRGRMHATVLSQLDKPRAIALNPKLGMIYWTEWGETPMLAGATMGGQDLRPLLDKDLVQPNGLYLDMKSSKLFIADNGTMSIRSVTTGQNVALLDHVQLTSAVGSLYGIGKLDASNSLVFSDWRDRTVMQMRGYDTFNDSTSVLMADLIRPAQLYVTNDYKLAGLSSVCDSYFHDCSHICIPNQNEYVCLCPDHLVLANDLRRCVTAEEAARITSTTPPPTTTTAATTTTTAQWAVKIPTTANTTTAMASTQDVLNDTTTDSLETTASTAFKTTAVITTTPVRTTPSTTTTKPLDTTTTALPQPTFTNCDMSATYQATIPADSSFVKVTPGLLHLKAVDGRGKPINVTSVNENDQPVGFVPVSIGTHVVHFQASDEFGQNASCALQLLVKDSTPPRTLHCPKDIKVENYIFKKPVYVFWKVPTFEDNSGEEATVTASHEPGFFSNGIYEVKYRASDGSGNWVLCNFTVAVIENTTNCGLPPALANSKMTCTSEKGVQKCLIVCDKGFLLALARPYIRCTLNVFTDQYEWFPLVNNLVCQKPAVGNVQQEVRLSYPCPCQPSADFYDTRRRNFESDLHKHGSCAKRKDRLGFCDHKSKIFMECMKEHNQLNVTVTVDMAELTGMATTNDVRRVVKRGSVEVVDMAYQGRLKALGSDEKLYEVDLSGDVPISRPLVMCEKGWISSESGCVQCPMGTFWKDNFCELCPVDYYQNQAGQTSCYKCPKNKVTATEGSMNVIYCKDKPEQLGVVNNNVIIGGVIGGVVLLLSILFIIGFVHRRRKNNRLKKEIERKRRQKMAKERRRRKQKDGGSGSGEAPEKSKSERPSKDSDRSQPIYSITNKRETSKDKNPDTTSPKTPDNRDAPDLASSVQDDLDTVSKIDTDVITETDATSRKSVDDDSKSAGAESAIFTDGGASDSVSVVSSEMPLKSALKKRRPRPPPSFLEDDASTVISASTISVGRVKRMTQRPTSLDADLGEDARRGRGARRSMSLRRPESASPSRLFQDGVPQSLPVQGMPIPRTISRDRGLPGPGFDPRLMPHPSRPLRMAPPAQVPSGSMPPGAPVMTQPARLRAPIYGTFGPRGIPAQQGARHFNPGRMRSPYMTLPPGGMPSQAYAGYWNGAFEGPQDWKNVPTRSKNENRPPLQMRTLPRNMGPRYRMPNGMVPGGPPQRMVPPRMMQRMPSPPPYYA